MLTQSPACLHPAGVGNLQLRRGRTARLNLGTTLVIPCEGGSLTLRPANVFDDPVDLSTSESIRTLPLGLFPDHTEHLWLRNGEAHTIFTAEPQLSWAVSIRLVNFFTALLAGHQLAFPFFFDRFDPQAQRKVLALRIAKLPAQLLLISLFQYL